MTMANFVVIGAAKAGTTALYHYLGQHPQIFMSPSKETNFFALEGEPLDFRGVGDPINRWSVTTLQDYQALFSDVKEERAIGEASPLYLYSPKAPRRIRHYIPDAKIIAMLRNPVERAYATYCFLVEQGREQIPDFAAALAAEEQRIQQKWEHTWYYRSLGYYHAQLSRYYELFDRSQIRVYLYEDYQRDNNAVLRDIFEFLEVDPAFSPDTSEKYRVSGIPKSKLLHRFLLRPHLLKRLVRPFLSPALRKQIHIALRSRNVRKVPMQPEVRQLLRDGYREDILKLQELLGRDLSRWLKA